MAMARAVAAAMRLTHRRQVLRRAAATEPTTAPNTIRASIRTTSGLPNLDVSLSTFLAFNWATQVLMYCFVLPNSSTGYAAPQDTRYQSYSQDYSQQYGSTAVDYNATGQADYSQHGAQSTGYDERAYAGYGRLFQFPPVASSVIGVFFQIRRRTRRTIQMQPPTTKQPLPTPIPDGTLEIRTLRVLR